MTRRDVTEYHRQQIRTALVEGGWDADKADATADELVKLALHYAEKMRDERETACNCCGEPGTCQDRNNEWWCDWCHNNGECGQGMGHYDQQTRQWI